MRTDRRVNRRGSLLLASGALLALGAGACRDQQSFVVVTVQSADPTPITGVTELIVSVTNAGSVIALTYPAPADDTPLTITGSLDAMTGQIGKTLSVSFTTSRANDVVVAVVAHDAARCTIGQGSATGTIKKGGIGAVTVELQHTAGPCEGTDAGSEGTLFPGCDPAALSCGAGMTCAVNCAAMQGQCVAAGTTAPGGLCNTGNVDCQPGTQCFTYSDTACRVPVCLKFCKTDNDCGPAGSGSVCQGKVPCNVDGGAVLTAYHTCSFACDPRGAATTGCPAGLSCFVVDTMDQVDCSCIQPTRVKAEGDPCARGVECQPGLICDLSTSKCQKVCKRSENNTDCAAGQTCTMLRDDQIYGVCL